MAGFISIYNRRVDKSKTVHYVGKNGVHYEYIMPIFGEPDKFYIQALDVKSKKSPTTKYKNGKKPGQYQPIGDKTAFTFYQLKKMRERGESEDYIEEIAGIISKFYEGVDRGVNNALFRN